MIVVILTMLLWQQQQSCNSSGGRIASSQHSTLRLSGSGARQSGRSAGRTSVADILLPLTNLGVVTTAALLDAAGGRAGSSTEKRELVRGHQDLYCRCAAASQLALR
jgi:hypothetical protein